MNKITDGNSALYFEGLYKKLIQLYLLLKCLIFSAWVSHSSCILKVPAVIDDVVCFAILQRTKELPVIRNWWVGFNTSISSSLRSCILAHLPITAL